MNFNNESQQPSSSAATGVRRPLFKEEARPALAAIDTNRTNFDSAKKSTPVARNILNELEAAKNEDAGNVKRGRDSPTTEPKQYQQPQNKKVKSSYVRVDQVYITKWIDYSCSIGLGYKLSDGTTNVLFNDGQTSKSILKKHLFYHFI